MTISKERKTVEQILADHGVFKGHEGLRGLANSGTFWGRQEYGTRLYYGDGISDYLSRGVLLTAVAAMESMAARIAELEHQREREVLELIDDRDAKEAMADKLASAIAERFGVDIGEHSNGNCPWQNALDAVQSSGAQGEPVLVVHKNEAGQLSLRAPDGSAFDMSRYVGASLYAHPAPAQQPAVAQDEMVEVAGRNLRSYLSKASFAMEVDRQAAINCLDVLRSAAQQPEFGAPYQGAREDLAVWKRRALEAEQKARHQDQIIYRLTTAINDLNGPTHMGEPVIAERPAVPKGWRSAVAIRDAIAYAKGRTAVNRGIGSVSESLLCKYALSLVGASPGICPATELPALLAAQQPAQPECCGDPSDCWEPCGELGKSEAHVRVSDFSLGDPERLCKGSVALGTGCRKCSRCRAEIDRAADGEGQA